MFGPTQLPSLRWQAGYRIGRKGQKVTRTFDTAEDATAWALAAEAAARHELAELPSAHLVVAPDPSGVTITQHGETWLDLKSSRAKGTRDGYACHLRAIEATGLGARELATVRQSDVQRWVNKQDKDGVGRPTVNARLKVLSMVYRSAIAEMLVGHNPADGVDKLAQDIPAEGNLKESQVQALLDNATPTQAAMVLLATDAGLRWSEMAGLTAGAIVDDFIVVRQVMERSTGSIRRYTKSKKPRRVPIGTTRLAEALAPLVAAAPEWDSLLFTSKAGTPLDYWDWRRDQWRPLCRAASLTNPRPRFHDLRHTYASTLAGRNVATTEIQKLLGHASLRTTELYVHAGDDAKRLLLVREALGA